MGAEHNDGVHGPSRRRRDAGSASRSDLRQGFPAAARVNTLRR